MKNLLAAMQFLTIIPYRIKRFDEKSSPTAMIYFPVIGLLLGLILIGVNNLLMMFNLDNIAANIILIILLMALTGGLHLDGLADTFDGLSSGKNRGEMLEIMRDPHIGVMGVLAVISIILLKISFLSSVSVSSKPASLLLMGVLSRWSMVFSMFLFPYARREGKAKIFSNGINSRIFFSATAIALACATGIWKLKGMAIFAIIALAAYIIGRFINSRINGITGDTLGATNELIEVVTLFSVCILAH